ncbi:MAG TPA: coenzyme F420-0:L-glutamate ligase [Solirubrobacteraceae bacterium]|jgi:coenzyme F420-0:L-glutamate ligase/coenzyme F420-1:gamma-L-glutamate ligase|nr:coenzyme F420-0:L-glutamate ligase [Solirubrobacteraceae bacterium]
MTVTATALRDVPEITPGSDLAALLAACAAAQRLALARGTILSLAHKIVSKAEGRVVRLDDVVPGERARRLADEHEKDARVVEVVLSESTQLVRAVRGVLICRTRHGFVCANAGVDASNADPGTLVLLPLDPDASARRLRAALGGPAVVISDSFGRAWRQGQCDVAIGCAGLSPLEDWRGRADSRGNELHATWLAVADQITGLADLARAKDSAEPAVLIGGLERHVIDEDGPGAAELIRPAAEDLFL